MKLHEMHLEYARKDELPTSEYLPFDERFAMIITAQYDARQRAKTDRLIKLAALREPTAMLENIDFDPIRKIKKADVARLSDCQ